MDDDELTPEEEARLDGLLRHFRRTVAAQDAATVDEMAARWNEEADRPPMRDGDVVLLGFEGQVDGVWHLPKPLPLTLQRPIRDPARAWSPLDDVDASYPSLRTAVYDRVGELTYQRVR